MAAADSWTKLRWRLQAVANNEAGGGCKGAAMIQVGVFLSGGLPVMWQRPQRIPLEPQNANLSALPLSPVRGDWDALMHCLTNGQRSGLVERTLIVKDGQPVGWLETKTELADLLDVM